MDKLLREMTGDLNGLSKGLSPPFTSFKKDFIQRLNSLEKKLSDEDFRDILIKPVLSNKNTFLHDICSKSFELIASQKDDEDEELITGKLEEFQKIFNYLIEKMKKYGIKSSEIKNKEGLNINDFIDSYVENIANSMNLDETDDIMMDIMPEMEDFQEAIWKLDESAKSGKASAAKSGKASASKERKKSPDNPEMEKLKQRIKHLLKENEKLVSNEGRMQSELLKVVRREKRMNERRKEDKKNEEKRRAELLKKNEKLETHLVEVKRLERQRWERNNELIGLLSESEKKIKKLVIVNENKDGVIKGRDTKINQLVRENKELKKQLKKANVNIELLEEREKAFKQEIKEADREKASLVKLIKSKEKVEKNILAYTNQLQRAYDSMTEKIIKESRAIEHSTKKLENMERMRKEMEKSKSPGERLLTRFKKLKGDKDIRIKHTELRKMKDKPFGKIPLSYDEMLEKFKKHRENMKALIAEGKKFRIVNREDLKSISLKPKVFTGTRKRERKRPPIINNSVELKKLRKMRKKLTRKIAFSEKKKKKKSKTRKKNRPYTL